MEKKSEENLAKWEKLADAADTAMVIGIGCFFMGLVLMVIVLAIAGMT